MIRILSKEEARALLGGCRMGRLGCVDDGSPYVVPVNYVFHDDRIYVHSLPGRKIEALRKNPRVCLQVDEVQDIYQWRSAIASGSYEEVTDEGERDWAIRRFLLSFPHLTPVESVPVPAEQSQVIVFRFRVDELSGVAEG